MAALLFSVLLLDYLRLFIDSALLRLLLLALWLVEWHAPARWVYFNPVNVEPLFLLAAVAGLIVIEKRRTDTEWRAAIVLIPLVFLGTLCRESMVLVPIAFVASRRPWSLPIERRWRAIGIVLLPLAAAALGVAWTRYLVEPTNQFDPIAEPLRMLRTKPVDSWLLACFFTYGPAAIALIAASARSVRRFLATRPELAVWLAGVGVLAFIGGTDTERLLGWAAPVVYVLLGLAILEHRQVLRRVPAFAAALIAIQLVSARLFWPIPGGVDNSEALPVGLNWPAARALADRIFVIDHFYVNLFSFFGSRSLHLVTLVADVLLAAAIVVVLRRRRPVL